MHPVSLCQECIDFWNTAFSFSLLYFCGLYLMVTHFLFQLYIPMLVIQIHTQMSCYEGPQHYSNLVRQIDVCCLLSSMGTLNDFKDLWLTQGFGMGVSITGLFLIFALFHLMCLSGGTRKRTGRLTFSLQTCILLLAISLFNVALSQLIFPEYMLTQSSVSRSHIWFWCRAIITYLLVHLFHSYSALLILFTWDISDFWVASVWPSFASWLHPSSLMRMKTDWLSSKDCLWSVILFSIHNSLLALLA